MDANTVRGLVNQVLYGIDGVPDLNDEAVVTRWAGNIVERRGYGHPAGEYAQAIDAVLREGRLSGQALRISRSHSEPALLDFLRRLARHLPPAAG